METIKAEAPARLDLWVTVMKSQPALDAPKIDRRSSNAIKKRRACALSSGYVKEEIIYVA